MSPAGNPFSLLYKQCLQIINCKLNARNSKIKKWFCYVASYIIISYIHYNNYTSFMRSDLLMYMHSSYILLYFRLYYTFNALHCSIKRL